MNRVRLDHLHEPERACASSGTRLRDVGRDARALAGVKIAAVGPATADALLEHGLAVDVAPDRFVAEALLDALRDRARRARHARALRRGRRRARDACRKDSRSSARVVDRVDALSLGRRRRRRAASCASGCSRGERRSRDVHVGVVGERRSSPRSAQSRGQDAGGVDRADHDRRGARSAGSTSSIEAARSTIEGLVGVDRRAVRGRAARDDRFIIATRSSELALLQARQVQAALAARGVESELKTYKTVGDKRLDQPLSAIGAKGLFTKELEDDLAARPRSLLRAFAQGSAD